jgi:hypothetical protein
MIVFVAKIWHFVKKEKKKSNDMVKETFEKKSNKITTF